MITPVHHPLRPLFDHPTRMTGPEIAALANWCEGPAAALCSVVLIGGAAAFIAHGLRALLIWGAA